MVRKILCIKSGTIVGSESEIAFELKWKDNDFAGKRVNSIQLIYKLFQLLFVVLHSYLSIPSIQLRVTEFCVFTCGYCVILLYFIFLFQKRKEKKKNNGLFRAYDNVLHNFNCFCFDAFDGGKHGW